MFTRTFSKPADQMSLPPPSEDPGGSHSEDEKWRCPICFDTLREPVVTPCGHLFCWPCIAEWLRRSNACPSCSGRISSDGLIPVYGQGKAATLTGPPPPRPDYIPARRGFWPIDLREITINGMRETFRPTAAKMFQLLALLLLACAVFVN
jgi:hypothetical protein